MMFQVYQQPVTKFLSKGAITWISVDAEIKTCIKGSNCIGIGPNLLSQIVPFDCSNVYLKLLREVAFYSFPSL